MGQKHGKASYLEEAKPFLNLPFPCVEALWEAFNDIADGFGVSSAEFKEVFSELCEDLDLKRERMDILAGKLFECFDTDRNDLVDAMEFLGTLAMSSGMTNREALEFVLNCYDFDGTQHLTIDEVTLAMKSTLTGLCKLTEEKMPREQELEMVAIHAFESNSEDPNRAKIPILEMIDFCTEDPDAKSWVSYFDDPKEEELEIYEPLEHDIDCQLEAEFPMRSVQETAAAEQDTYAFQNQPSDETLKSQSWFATVESLVPSDVANLQPNARATVPNCQIELEWVHGYRSDDVRNNLFYTAKGDAVYHAGRLGIVLNCLNRQQRYHMAHADDILCLAMHPGGDIVATGEAGVLPRIMIWETDTVKTLKVLRGFHRGGVTQLAFSGNGTKLISIGHDEDHSLALYDWEKEELLFSSKNTTARIYACCFMEGGMLVSSGEDHIYFWVRESKTYVKRKGIFGRKGKVQSLLCLMPLRDRVVSGSVSGHLYVWAGRNCVKAIKAHYGSVNALCVGSSCCVSGGKDHRVRLWTLRLEPGATFDLSSFGLLPSVRSVALSADTARILVGTRGGEVYEISSADGSDTQGGPLTTGHFQGGLWGLSCHPFKKEYATAGSDATVRVWDMDTCHLIKMTKLDSPATAIEYSIDGETLVIGLGLANPQQPVRKNEVIDSESIKKEGGFVVMNESDLAIVYEAKDSTKPITDIKFSPSGEYVAVASADSDVYVYQAGDPYELIGKFRSHQSPVLHVDFSADSEWGRSTCMGKELFFFSSKTAEPMENIAALRDLSWASENCPYVWSTQGVFSPQLDGSEIFSCDKGGPNGKVLATGDNFGRIHLFRSPCLKLGSAFHEFRGHSGGVGKMYFSFDSSKLISIGSSDRCVFQWKYSDTVGSDDEDAQPKEEMESDGYILDLCDGSDLERSDEHDTFTNSIIDMRLKLQIEDVKQADVEDGIPLKPWREFAGPPTTIPPVDLGVSNSSLELEWVHGYRAHDCRNNVGYSEEGNLVYHVGTLGVSFNKDTHTQIFNSDHNDEIVSFALSPCKKYAATGQIGARPYILIWEADTGKTLAKLQGIHRRAVSVLTFSEDSNILASVGNDDDHTIAVYNWRNGTTLLATGKGGPRKVLALAFHSDGGKLVQCGLKHITFWTIKGRHLNSTRGLISTQGNLQTFLSCIFLEDTPIVGTADGHLYCFEGVMVSRSVKAHEGAVYALSLLESGLCSGGKDGWVKLWNMEFETTHSFNLNELLGVSGMDAEVRAVCPVEEENKVAVGLRGSEIYELNIERGTVLGDNAIIQGHGRGEVWGLACHPSKPEFITSGDDGVLRMWDVGHKRPTRHLKMDVSSRAVTFSPSGMAIVVGLGGGEKKAHKKSGGFVVFQYSDLSLVHEGKDSQEWIRAVSYSPDGKTLALASQDTQIYMYNVVDGYSRKAVVSAHKASVCHLDFSADSQFLRSTDTSWQLCFSEVSSGGHIQSVVPVRDVKWATSTCPLGWEVQGLWEPERTKGFGVEYQTVSRAFGGGVLASGDNFGRVGLTLHPCAQSGAAVEIYRGHGPNVRRLRWTTADTHLISCGGPDGAVIQWRHIVDTVDDSADEGGHSGEDSELETDGGLKYGLPGSGEDEAKFQLKQGTSNASEDEGAIKPWITTMVPPSNLEEENMGVPKFRAKLQYVQGCRAEDVRNVVKYTAEDCIAYPAAGVGIIYKSRERTQEFFEGHKGDVISLAITSDGKFIATGEVALIAQVVVWDSMTGMEVKSFPPAHLRAVSILNFSHSGRMLAAVGQDREHTAVIYRSATGNWTDGMVSYQVKIGAWKVLFCLFAGLGDLPLMAGGVDKVLYFYPVPGGLYRRSGIFGRQKKIQPTLCGIFRPSENDVVTGVVSGQLFVWGEAGRVIRTVRAHDGSVYCITPSGKSGAFVTGGRDGVIKMWTNDFTVEKSFNIVEAKPIPYLTAIHSVCPNRVSNKIVVGTKSGEIYEISKESGRMLLLVESHSCDELHSLCTHPTDPTLYATAGDDQVIRIWNTDTRQCICRDRIDSPIRAIAWSPDGEHLALGLGGLSTVGMKDGTLMVVSAANLEILYEIRKSKQYITDLKYSPDGSRIVASSMDGKCYFHNTKDYSLELPTKPLDAGIQAVDFSVDGTMLRAASTDFDLVYFNVADASRLTANNVRDVTWATGNSPFGWNMQGLWEKDGVPQDLRCVDRAKERKVTISGYKDGSLKVHNFPAHVSGMKSASVSGFGSQVSKVKFTANEDHIVSVGTFSRVICQYKFEPFEHETK